MESVGEELIRSALHDTANLLSGIRGILDLSDPQRPLSARDRERLDAVLKEGLAMVNRTRHIAMGSLPDRLSESPQTWAPALREQLEPLSRVFRAPIEVSCDVPASQPVPGPYLRDFAHAMARLLLPYAGEEGLKVRCRKEGASWILEFEPAEAVPDSLSPATVRKDIAARWICHLRDQLGFQIEHQDLVLKATLRA